MFRALIFCLAVFAGGVVAQDSPKAVITDPNGNPLPEKVPAGEVIYLSASQAVCGDKPNSIVWVIEPPARAERSRVFGKEVCIPLGKVDCTLVVTQIVAKGDEASYAKITIQIDGDDVKPDPGPGPKPDPDPPKPDPTPVDGLGTIVIRDLKPAIEAKLAILSDADDFKLKASFFALSQAYKQLASEIKANKFTKIDDLLDKTKVMSRAALGNNLDVWGTAIRNIEKELETTQPDLPSLEKKYLEIAKGIDLILGV